MVVLFGLGLPVALAGLGLYRRLSDDERPRARVALWAPILLFAIPLAILVLWMIAVASMGPV